LKEAFFLSPPPKVSKEFIFPQQSEKRGSFSFVLNWYNPELGLQENTPFSCT